MVQSSMLLYSVSEIVNSSGATHIILSLSLSLYIFFFLLFIFSFFLEDFPQSGDGISGESIR